MKKYNFADEFSKNPGLRFRHLSDFSGQEFREEVLEKFFEENEKVLINIEGIESALGASFLSEAFGNSAVNHGIKKFNEIISIDTTTIKGQVTNEEMKKRVEEALERQKRNG